MRALGALRGEMFALLLVEAALLTIIGIVLGWLLGHGAVQVASVHYRENMGLAIQAWTIGRVEILSLLSVALAGVIAGLVPAAIAYRSSPVKDLSRI